MAKREKQNLNIKKPENGSPRRAFGWERTGSSSRLMFFFFFKERQIEILEDTRLKNIDF